MPKKVKLTRAEIILAIKTEPLSPGTWINGEPDEKDCQVCAVGGVLRRRYGDVMDEDELNSLANDLTNYGAAAPDDDEDKQDVLSRLLGRDSYLNALSYKFEWLCDDAGIEEEDIIRKNNRVRADLVAWVRKNLPKEFTASTA